MTECRILVDATPSGVRIQQVQNTLLALSECCAGRILYNSHFRVNNWMCEECGQQIPSYAQPKAPIGMARADQLSSQFYLDIPKKDLWYSVEEWLAIWTRYNVDDIKVVVT